MDDTEEVGLAVAELEFAVLRRTREAMKLGASLDGAEREAARLCTEEVRRLSDLLFHVNQLRANPALMRKVVEAYGRLMPESRALLLTSFWHRLEFFGEHGDHPLEETFDVWAGHSHADGE